MSAPNEIERRGSPAIRWLYGRWRQVLVFFDLAGDDGRPSATKLTAVAVVVTMLYIAARTKTAPGGVVTLIICVFAILFGRREFRFFLSRWSGRAETQQRDDTERRDVTQRTTTERRDPERGIDPAP